MDCCAWTIAEWLLCTSHQNMFIWPLFLAFDGSCFCAAVFAQMATETKEKWHYAKSGNRKTLEYLNPNIPLDHTPQDKKKFMKYWIYWFRVWGMFQGYVEKCLDSWNCPLNWWNILAEGSYTAQAPQTDLESYPSWRSCQASFLSKTTRNAWSFERAVVAVWVSWMYITNKLSYMYIYIYTCIIYKL